MEAVISSVQVGVENDHTSSISHANTKKTFYLHDFATQKQRNTVKQGRHFQEGNPAVGWEWCCG